MAYTTIPKSSDYFNTKLYTGNASTLNITGLDFQPDLCWLKIRSAIDNHALFDSVRGVQKRIASNLTAVESNRSTSLTSFNSDGFTLGNNSETNANSGTYAAWNWLANGAGVSNTDGSISSTVSVNTISGFSIVSFTGTGANATVGHGLGVAPKMVILKSRANAYNWGVYHASIGATKYLRLNSTNAEATSSAYFQDTAPTSTFITLGSDLNINDSGNMIAYCFAEKQGYSKFGSYTGNGNDDGAFVYTGFKPAFVMVKITAGQADNWIMQDNKINSFNGASSQRLRPNSSGAEFSSSNEIDLLSNGFKTHGADGEINGSGFSYSYMAFASEPLVGDNPATAR